MQISTRVGVVQVMVASYRAVGHVPKVTVSRAPILPDDKQNGFHSPKTHLRLQSVREPTSIQNDSGLAQSLNRTVMASPATYSHDDVRKTFSFPLDGLRY